MFDTVKYKLAPYVAAGIQNGRVFFGFGSLQRSWTDTIIYLPVLEAASMLKTERTRAEAIDLVTRRLGDTDSTRAAAAVQLLIDGHFAVSSDKLPDADDRYKRPLLYYALNGANPQEVQQKIARKTVMVLGCGGIGNIMATALATSGVGRIYLVDADIIETSNLSRQYMFDESEVGRKKVEVLAEKIRARNAACQVEILDADVDSPESLSRLPACDLLILSADTPAGLVWWVNDYCVRNKTAFLNVGYVVDVAVWGPFVIPGITGCWSCQSIVATDVATNQQVESLISEINRGLEAASTGPINLLSSSGALLDAIKFLGEFGSIESANARIGIWTHSMKIERQSCERNPNCAVCGEKVQELTCAR